MRKQNTSGRILATLAFCIILSSCTTIKEFQKNKINDAEMDLSLRKVEKGDNYFQTISEGASGADGGKVGGGCGCN